MQGVGVLGAGAAACVACCAPSVVGFLAAAGAITVVGVALSGVAALAVLAVVAGAYPRRRRRTYRHEADQPIGAGVPVVLGRKPGSP